MKTTLKHVLSIVLALCVLMMPLAVSAAPGGTQAEAIAVQQNGTVATDGSGVAKHYVYQAPEAGEYVITVTGSLGTDSYGTRTLHPMFGYEIDLYAYENELTINATTDESNKVYFTLFDQESQTLTLSIVHVIGTHTSPDTMVLGTNTANTPEDAYYYYTWTATEDGTLTVTMQDSEAGWAYTGYVIGADESYKSFGEEAKTSADTTDTSVCKVSVKAGDVVTLQVQTLPDAANWGAVRAGTVTFTASFDTTVMDDDIPGDDNNQDDNNQDSDDDLNYAISDTAIEVGAKDYAVDTAHPYTAYVFKPTETGKYTISVADGLIGIVSYIDMWVQHTPSDENVKETSLVWECTSVGQGIYVAVKADVAAVNITVEREELVVKEEVPWIIYENVVTPKEFKLEGKFDDMMYVDTFDSVVDKAVLGEDGYYHLNDATGPILYACLSDSLMDLADAWQYGQLKEVIVDAEGNIVERTDFYYAFDEYQKCMDASGVYPLTVDIIEMFKRIGAYHNWYGESGFIGGDLEDAWMFACYYNEGETVKPGATTTTTTKTPSPNTADASDAMNMLFAAILAAGAVVTAVSFKKAKA